MKKIFVLLFLSAVLMQCKSEEHDSPLLFPADSPGITYAGRIDFTNPKAPVFCYEGVSIKTVFIGYTLSMVLEDFAEGGYHNANYYTIIINGQIAQTIEALPGKHSYPVVSGHLKKTYTVEIFKRTECMVGNGAFYGFTAEGGAILLKPQARSRSIEFIGDSFTAGYGNEVSIPAPPAGNPSTGFHSRNENNYEAYGAITARNLNADYRCVAYAGKGVYRNSTGATDETIPKIYDRIIATAADSPLWDFQKSPPKVVVINLGINDFFPEVGGDPLDDGVFIATYVDFLATLRSHYPQAKLVCVAGTGLSDNYPAGGQFGTRINQDLTTIVQQRKNAGDLQVYYLRLDEQTPPYGEDFHPAPHTHQKMAAQLTPFLRNLMLWLI